MSIHSEWTTLTEDRAHQVYDRLVAAAPTYDAPYGRPQVAYSLGVHENYVSMLMAWVYRNISPQTGVYFGSKRGRNGGYYITDNRIEAEAAEVSELQEMWNHMARINGIVAQRQTAGLGNKASIRRVYQMTEQSKIWIEEALAEHGIRVGSTAP
jgi:hypothetical protein